MLWECVCLCVCFCDGMCANKQTFFRDIDEGVWQMMLGKIDYDDETNRAPTVFDYGCVRLSSSHCPSKEDKRHPSFWSMKICVGHKSTISQRYYLYILVNHVLSMYIESLRCSIIVYSLVLDILAATSSLAFFLLHWSLCSKVSLLQFTIG